MTSSEELLTDHLRQKAAGAQVAFTLEDVVAPLARVEPLADRRQVSRPRLVFAAAAVILTIVGAVAVLNSRSSSRIDIAAPGALDIEPLLLASDAKVFQMANVGRFEVGGPGGDLLRDNPWLEGAHCASTDELMGCMSKPDASGTPTIHTSHTGRGGHASQNLGLNEPFVVFKIPADDGVIIVADLPEDAVEVELRIGDVVARERVAERAAAFPLNVDDEGFTLKAINELGGLVWSTYVEIPHFGPDGPPRLS